MRLIACNMPLMIKSQPRKATTATDDMAGKIKAKMPARIMSPLCTRYQNECRFIFSRIASRMTWAAASTDIDGEDMRVAVGRGEGVHSYHRIWCRAVYWAEVQLGPMGLDVNSPCQTTDEGKPYDVLADGAYRCSGPAVDRSRGANRNFTPFFDCKVQRAISKMQQSLQPCV